MKLSASEYNAARLEVLAAHKERDEARAQVQRLTEERDALVIALNKQNRRVEALAAKDDALLKISRNAYAVSPQYIINLARTALGATQDE